VLFFLVTGVVLTGCGRKALEMYYPKAHFTKMVLDQADKKVVYLEWGVPLAYAGKVQTNYEEVKGKSNEIIYVLVVNQSTKERGWVDVSTVVKNPIAKATLLNNAVVFKTPSEVSREFFTMNAPMIGYVVEVQDDWARVQWYMAAYKVFTGKSEWTTYEWIKWNQISTNSKDADLLSLLYLSYTKFSTWKEKWPTLMDSNQIIAMSNEIEKELIYLDNLTKAFADASTVNYAIELYKSIDYLIHPVVEESGDYGEGYQGEDTSEDY
jgi:hypothetical protein